MLSARQKKKLRRIIISAAIVAVLIPGGFILYQLLVYRKPKFTRYPEFGIAIPESYSIHGIDVSKYQSMIAWEEVKAMKVKNIQLGFAFIKATEGIGNTDPQFKRNWKKTKENDIIRGAYHFFIGSKDGRMQAENFIDKVELEPGDMLPVVDAEQLNGATAEQLKKEMKRWLEIVENHYGVKPIIYTNVDFYENFLAGKFDDYPLWVAHYLVQDKPRIQRNWTFWQHNEKGHVNGIDANVDFNVFNGDSTGFRQLLVK